MYLDGTGVPTDTARGRGMLAEACAANAQVSCHVLAERLRDGKGLPARPAEALPLFVKACDLGWGKSCLAVAELLTEPAHGLTLDAARAARFREQACTAEPRFCPK